MAQNILVVLDGAQSDDIVSNTTLELAKTGNASVTVLGVTDPDRSIRREAVPAGAMHYKMQADQRRYAALKAQIGAFAEHLATQCRELGATAKAIMAEGDGMATLKAHWNECTLLMMGRQKRGEGTRLLSRRGLIRLLRDCPCPVLVSSAAQRNNPETVAIAYDGSEQGRDALKNFLDLGLGTQFQLEVVSVQSEIDRARQLAKEAAVLCDQYKVQYRTFALETDRQPLSVLANRLLALRPGLMVLASAGAHTWRELFFGSLPARLLRGSNATLYLHR